MSLSKEDFAKLSYGMDQLFNKILDLSQDVRAAKVSQQVKAERRERRIFADV